MPRIWRASRYRPLDQINAANFNKLEVAWRFKTDSLGNRPEYKLEGTPLMVNGVVYATAGSRRAVIALDAATGELLWVHGEHEGARGAAAPRQLSGRGLAYWTDGKEARILYVTPGYRLIALDAKTGALVPAFGDKGAVDLKLNDDQTILPDLTTGEIGLQSAPVVAKDVILIGAAFREGMTPRTMRNNKGYVRGFDVRTGKRLWIFHTIPVKGEPGYETWENGSAEYTGNTGVWTQITVDEQLGLVYLPVESPTGDYYGGHRPGTNLYGESLVCVDLKTGQRKWHFQLVHHPLWDMDISSAPLLADITVDGRAVKAVAQPTKQGFLYVLDRVTGKPVWPIPEQAGGKGQRPGRVVFAHAAHSQQAARVQPQRSVRRGPDRLHAGAARCGPDPGREIQAGTGLHAAGGEQGGRPAGHAHHGHGQRRHQLAGRFLRSRNPHGLRVRLQCLCHADRPGPVAEGNLRHELHRRDRRAGSGHSAWAPVKTPAPIRPCPPGPRPPRAGGGGGGGGLTIQGLPLMKPPYATISAINLDKGEIVWQIAHGETPDAIRNHAALKGLNDPAHRTIGI